MPGEPAGPRDGHAAVASRYVNRGIELLEAGRPHEAVDWFRKALAADPASDDIAFDLGLALLRSGQPARARDVFEHLLSGTGPADAPAVHDGGTPAYRSSRPTDLAATPPAGRAGLTTTDRTMLADTHANLGLALYELGHDDAAEHHYLTALALMPDHPEASNNLGVIFFRRARYAEARGCFELALRSRPEYADAHLNLVDTIEMLGEVSTGDSPMSGTDGLVSGIDGTVSRTDGTVSGTDGTEEP